MMYKFTAPPSKREQYDSRLDVALLRPAGQTVDDYNRYLQELEAYKTDKTNTLSMPIPQYHFEFFLPPDDEKVSSIKRNFTTFDPDNEDEISFDHGVVQDLDAVGTAVDAGTHLFLGVVSGTDRPLPTPKATATRVQAWWNELGFPAEQLHTAVTLTPSCGLAGASPAYARAAMTHVREAARYLLPG